VGQFPGSVLGNTFAQGALSHRWVDVRAPEVRYIMLQVWAALFGQSFYKKCVWRTKQDGFRVDGMMMKMMMYTSLAGCGRCCTL
jgi:hypothetical protein